MNGLADISMFNAIQNSANCRMANSMSVFNVAPSIPNLIIVDNDNVQLWNADGDISGGGSTDAQTKRMTQILRNVVTLDTVVNKIKSAVADDYAADWKSASNLVNAARHFLKVDELQKLCNAVVKTIQDMNKNGAIDLAQVDKMDLPLNANARKLLGFNEHKADDVVDKVAGKAAKAIKPVARKVGSAVEKVGAAVDKTKQAAKTVKEAPSKAAGWFKSKVGQAAKRLGEAWA